MLDKDKRIYYFIKRVTAAFDFSDSHMPMTFLSFEYVTMIHKIGTIRGAAAELYISPQALSEHLNKLEREIDAPLFHRTKPLTLTKAGERFLACAETCLTAKAQLETELDMITRRNDNRISLGVPSGMPPPLLLSFLSYCRYVHPELTVSTVELPTITGAFSDIPGHIDVIIGEMRGESGRLVYTPILQSRQFVVALRRSLLHDILPSEDAARLEQSALEGSTVSLREFQSCPFVLKRSGSIIREKEDRLFRQAHITPKGEIETGDMELTVRMVLLGQAAVFFPKPVALANFMVPDSLSSKNSILLCPIRVSESEAWQLNAGYSKYRRVSASIDTFIQTAKEYYAGVLGDGQQVAVPC